MDWAKHGSLVAAILYVIAVGAVLAGRAPEVPVPVMNSLEVRPLVLLARTVPPAGEDGKRGEWQDLTDLVRTAMEQVAHKPLATPLDRLRTAAAAAGIGARHLVAPLAGPLALTDPAAGALVRWAFDPAYAATDADLAALRGADLPPPLGDMAVASLAQDAGRTADATAARGAWSTAAQDVRETTSLQVLLFVSALVVGTILWFRMRRLQIEEATFLRPKPTIESLLPVAKVLVYFTASFLTLGILGPDLIAGLDIPGGFAGVAVGIYVVNAVIGIALILNVGGARPGESALDTLGLRTLRPAGILAGAAWGVGGWCMLVPAVLSASVMAATLLGIGGNPFDNPVTLMLVLDPTPETVALLLVSVTILAPLFEETFFRGFLHGRLRRHFTPYGSAMISGFCFALAHLSLSNLLPLWALGFALGVLYDRTRSLWAPMIAHGLWNLGTAAFLLSVFT
jgi:membrane protease YdiL (CAAX protease family)